MYPFGTLVCGLLLVLLLLLGIGGFTLGCVLLLVVSTLGCVYLLVNIFFRVWSSLISSSVVANGEFGFACLSAADKFLIATIASSSDDAYGILQYLGWNSTVSDILSPLVSGMYILWHL